ncbi:MAG: M48 family metallopeptidase [Alphaproteobacteria bacterium]|nr:M48 family metallopeptidase [Alphaproteobacteria bacterium]
MTQATIDLSGNALVIDVSVSERARNINLRVDERGGRVKLILPRFVSQAEGLAFARRKAGWIARQLRALPPHVPFCDGAVLPFGGGQRRIEHQRAFRGSVTLTHEAIVVGGDPRFLARRLRDWLRTSARQTLAERACVMATTIERRVRRITIRDPRSRWGSCTADGQISFSWRLLLAPEPVMNYVVAHEVAHLVELNHGPRFWRIVARLCPDYRDCRRWLRENGAALHRFG